MIKPVLLSPVLLLAIAFSVDGKLTPEQLQKLPPPASGQIDFTRDIKPIFEASCIKCHGRGKDKGGFNLDTRKSFLKGGDNGPVALNQPTKKDLVFTPLVGGRSDTVTFKTGLPAATWQPLGSSSTAFRLSRKKLRKTRRRLRTRWW